MKMEHAPRRAYLMAAGVLAYLAGNYIDLLAEVQTREAMDQAAFVAPIRCRDEIATELGNTLLAATEEDSHTAIQANSPTSESVEHEAVELDIAGLPSLQNYMDTSPLIESGTLPDSGIPYELLSTTPGWHLNPAFFEEMVSAVYAEGRNHTLLRGLTYECTAREVFDYDTLAGHPLQVIIIGAGDKCIVKDEHGDEYIADRANGPCNLSGIHFNANGVIAITPNGTQGHLALQASSILAHEFDHWMVRMLGLGPRGRTRSERKLKLEYRAYEFQSDATDYLRAQGHLPLRYLPPQTDIQLPLHGAH